MQNENETMKKVILICLICILSLSCRITLGQDSLSISIFKYYKADKKNQERYKVIIDSIEARRSRLSKSLKEYKSSGRNIDNFFFDWSNETRFINKQLKTETSHLIADLLYFSYLDLGYGIYGLNLDSSIVVSALNSISSKSPLWSLEPSLMEVAIRYSNNYERYKNYIISAINENPNDNVRNYANLNLSPYRKIMTGNQVPAFSFSLMNDTLQVVSPQTFKGKYLLIDFWATWCKPCIEEMPRLHRIFKQYHNKGLDILSISLDDELSVIKKFQLNNWEMPWYNVQVTKTNQATKLFDVKGIPYPILINTKGIIIAAGDRLRGKFLEEALAKLEFKK
jgi:thiol-disulfide isomerase/thioredoxin